VSYPHAEPGDPRPNDLKEQRARRLLVNALRECGELADGVEHFEGEELFDVLTYLDSLRLIMTENQNILIGLVRGEEGSPPVPRANKRR
jgi:hypothetical protein